LSFFGLSGAQLLGVVAAVAAPLVALYLLRMHRQRVEVPFVKLWERVLAERQPSSWWRRLRRLLSLLLQLAFAALVILALGDPRFSGTPRGARSVVVVVDCSASMQARDVAPSRMARARDETRRILRSLGGSDSAMIVRMDAEPVPQSGWEGDAAALDHAVDSLEATDTAADWDGALAIANDALRGRPGPTIIVISDGALRETSRVTTADVRFVPIGTGGENVGVTAFSVRRYPANKSSYEVLLEVVSHAQKPVKRTLTLEADGDVVDVATLELQPGEKTRRFYPNLSGASSKLVAKLEPHDAFPTDDVAYALLPPRKKQHVLIVTPGNLFLEGAFLLEESADVDRIGPAAYTAEKAKGYDAVVFDRFAPRELPKVRGALFVAPPAEGSPFAVRGSIPRPFLTELAQQHPLMRWISLTDVNISEAEVFGLERGDVALAGALHQPIIVAGQRGATKVMAIGFDVRKSDLPMRVAFPVMLVGALDWFAGDDGNLLGTYRTGRPWHVPSPGGAEVTLIDPSGGEANAPVGDDGAATFFGRHVGFHRVRAASGETTIAANLTDPAESDISPRPLLVAGRTALPPDLTGTGPRRQIWAWLVVAALLLTIFEWVSYQRRWTV
jgi:VWA domain-containing protein/aerotolerance regulator-like protein